MNPKRFARLEIGHKSNRLVLNETAELLGLSLRMTEDQLTRDMLAASASVYKCSGGNNGDLPSNLSLSDIDEVTSTLLTNDAWMILNRQEGENRFGTGPVRDAYMALGHTKLSKDINNLNGVISKWNYPLLQFVIKLVRGIKIFTNLTRKPYTFA